MGNYTKSFNFRNGVQVDDSNFIVNANGLVGIGTSIPEKRLDVRGNTKIIGDTTLVGLTSITNLNVVGVVTIGSAVKIDSGSGIVTATKFVGDASGLTNIIAIATDGFIVNAGSLSTTSKIGIGTNNPSAPLQIDDVSPKIILRDTDNNSDVSIHNVGGAAVYSSSGDVLFQTSDTNEVLRIASNGQIGIGTIPLGIDEQLLTINGDSNYLAGIRLKQAGVSKFRIQAEGGTGDVFYDVYGLENSGGVGDHVFRTKQSVTNGVVEALRINEVGNVGIGSQIPEAKLDVNGKTELDDLNVSGVTTHKDDVEFHGVGGISSITFDKSDNSLNFKDNAKAQFGTDSDFEIYHGEEKNFLKSGASTNTEIWSDVFFVKSVTGNGEAIIKGSEGGSVELYHNNVKRVETISTGASVYNQLNVASLDGGTSGLSSHFGSLRYGNQDSSQTYSTRRSLDLINTDSGNVNFYLNANNLEAPNDGSDFHWHKGFNNDQLMTLTGIGGSLGIGVTNPTVSLEVDGKIKVTGLSTFTNKLFVGNNLSVKEDLDVIGTITGSLSGSVNGNVNATSGISTFNNVSTGVATVTTLKASKIGIKTSLVGSNDLFKIDVIPDNEIIVDDAGRIGIRTTSSGIATDVVINASQTSAVFGIVGVGTTRPLSAADFSNAGADVTGSFANKMFMLPPKVNNTQRVGLLTETGAMIYNTSLNKLQVYTGSSWETITSA